MKIFRRIRELEKGEARHLLVRYIWTIKARILASFSMNGVEIRPLY